MSTITGKLSAAANIDAIPGSVDVMLCGYGSRVPRVNGVSLVARLTVTTIKAAADGTFTFTVAGNDAIIPAGTYYTVTVRDSNGDISQVNAYRFLSSTPNYDLDGLDPIDPNLPPPPLPSPAPGNEIINIPWAPSIAIDGSQHTCFRIILAGDTVLSITNFVAGNLYTFLISQDPTGGHALNWGAGIHNPDPPSRRSNGLLVQTFVAFDSNTLFSIAPGTYQ